MACAGLFLIIAAAFTAAIYTVVDRSFGPTPPPSSVPAGLARTCQTAEANGTLKLDPALAARCQYFLGAANPWALNAIAERLLEAANRELWENPAPETLEALRDVLLESETLLEALGERKRGAVS